MDELLRLIGDVSFVLLCAVLVVSLVAVLKGADFLVDGGVALSINWGVPTMLIGATIVSLGTTLPETVVSVLAALRGAPGLALGNAVGSIIANGGLILGIATMIRPIHVEASMVGRQNAVSFGSAILLVLLSVPYLSLEQMFSAGGRLPQGVGIAFVVLLGLYIWQTLRRSRSAPGGEPDGDAPTVAGETRSTVVSIAYIAVGLTFVVAGSWILIPTVGQIATRLGIPDAIIAATLVAFGTSLPELATAVTAARKGHGELALGNVIGANILNVLFVSGASAAVTSGGLHVPPPFFYLFFPSMIFIVSLLGLGVVRHKGALGHKFGAVLLGAYVLTVVAGYVVPN